MKIVVNGKNISLNQSDYLAQGGEASVYKKDGNAYKIYHDPTKNIKVGKITELAALKNISSVLGPRDIVYDSSGNPLGFSMNYVSNCEFLCRLFTSGFRNKNGISKEDIANLVKLSQSDLNNIHKENILVVDINPMNFLTSSDYSKIYWIDVDSWKTKSYPATALMESVRDRKSKKGEFSELTDWFSWACVMFELYIGCHPYKGRHPDYNIKDWMKMMDDGVSVFNKNSKLPPATQPLSNIPVGHLKWFQDVFEHGDRSIPPEPDKIKVNAVINAPTVILSNSKFDISAYLTLPHCILSSSFLDGICYSVTEGGIYANNKELVVLNSPKSSKTKRIVVSCIGGLPLYADFSSVNKHLKVYSLNKEEVFSVNSEGIFSDNEALYSICGDKLLEISFLNRSGKITASQQVVGNIMSGNSQVFDSVVIQNILNNKYLSIPFKKSSCAFIKVDELKKYRIVSAKRAGHIVLVVGENNGKYDRILLHFDENFVKFTTTVESDVDLCEANIIKKDNGVYISENGDKLEAFASPAKIKQFDSPITDSEILVGFKNDTFLIKNKILYKVSSKP